MHGHRTICKKKLQHRNSALFVCSEQFDWLILIFFFGGGSSIIELGNAITVPRPRDIAIHFNKHL